MSSARTSEPIPVTLLTGFLGSGKTTLLNHLVRQPEMADALVIINEFGEIPLDHKLVAHSTENLVMEMSSGCLCCTIRHDLARTLRDVAWRFARNGQRQFRRVVIETTGLADPAPILHTLMTHPRVADRYRLDGIVTTLDMSTGQHSLDQHEEAVKQLAMADCVLLTKPEGVSLEQRVAVMTRLDRINPSAPRHEVEHGEINPALLLNLGVFNATDKIPDVTRWLNEEAYTESHAHHHGHDHDHDHDINRHDERVRAFCFAIEAPIPEETFESWLEVLMRFVGSNVLRIKGILNIAGSDRPRVVQGVQHIFYPPVTLPDWPDEDRRSRLVFITRDIDREVIEATFAFVHDQMPAAREALSSEATTSRRQDSLTSPSLPSPQSRSRFP